LIRTYSQYILLVIFILAQAGLKAGRIQAADTPTAVIQQKADSVKALPESVQLAPTTSPIKKDSLAYKPDPKKAVWASILCPGLGQLYNKRYWKLPFIGAGIVGVAYAIHWNSKYYNAYTNAYRDILDDDPNTESYLKLMPVGTVISDPTTLTTVVSNRQKKYRRQRDLSYMGAAGLYVFCILDAFVDAELYDFDISPDLSVSPKIGKNVYFGNETLEFGLAFHF
jgi:hypothetical protein